MQGINYEKIRNCWKGKGEPKPELFSEIARNCAEVIQKEGKKRKNKSSQLRRYYDEFLNIFYQYKYKGGDFEVVKAKLHRIIPFVYYGEGRKLITPEVRELFENLIKDIETEKDLEIVKDFLEALMAYHKYYEEIKQ